MNKIMVILSIVLFSCSDSGRQESKNGHDTSALQLNNGSKWQTDEATRRNVVAIQQVINQSTYSNRGDRDALVGQLQLRIDTLIQQCRMRGPAHDALHLWLEKVLNDVRALKEGNDEAYLDLKKDINLFSDYFQ